jgi:hypothetical protein
MSRAGHSDFKTTQLYIDLAGQTFREEAELSERRLLGGPVEKSGRNTAAAGSAADGDGGDRRGPTPADQGFREERSGAGVEPTEPWVARPHRF